MGKVCMNQACNATATSPDWKRGWALNSGGFATLCSSCGSSYDDSLYCDTFHQEESGWRECRLCGMRIHCGCIVSKDLHTYLDSGGVGCIGCSKKLEKVLLRPNKVPIGGIPNGIVPRAANNVIDLQSTTVNYRTDSVKVDKGMFVQLNKVVSANEKLIQLSKAENKNDGPTDQIKQEGMTLAREVGAATGFADLLQQCVGPSLFAKQDCMRQGLEVKRSVSASHSALSFSLATSSHTPNTLEEKELSKGPPFQQGLRTGQNMPKFSKTGLDANRGTASETRVPRPPAEGRGRGQLLPRYWPRITDQELQQISGDLNSTVVPLFEKVLSASDAGRIGRLVLPKACAEAYFPPISQSEGLPIRVQDIKGKEWTFQFRFWPNNNSRMYVLEGVTPCIQNMQLEAGDTVTFSRIDPGGKLVMGFRKSSSTGDMLDCQSSALCNNTGSGKVCLPAVNENQPRNDGGGTNGAMPHQQHLIPKKKKTRNIGFKSKRLHMHSEDAMELRLTWDEAQELLRPPPCAKPNIVVIEDRVFEEYEEPPVFGKRTIFTSGASGNQEQWAQCDSCFKWRRLPVDFLVPPRWTCSENIWDYNRCSCSASGEMNAAELKGFLRLDRDIKKRRVVESPNIGPEHEASGLDALATAAVLGENTEGPGEPSMGPTTRHPRHRPGCTCIVCIQPPSGKGRHKPNCICNVCLTVKRRFKTLMLRKKKRQLEPKVELVFDKEKAKPFPLTNDSDTNGLTGRGFPLKSSLEDERSQNKFSELDLNCDPNREEDMPEAGTGMVICHGGNSITRPSTSKCHALEEKCILSTVGKQENREDENKDEEG